MKTVQLPCGERVSALGLGTWRYGERDATRNEELATIRLALDLGVTLIDTAEMYGDGRTEELIGQALQGRRDEAYLVSKVYPHNASRSGAPRACELSLRRLGTDRLDLYLLHWRGGVPLVETIAAFQALQQAGKIRHYGVSNLDAADMQELWAVPGGPDVQTDQVLYNLLRRGIEWDLLPWLRERRVPVMAYSPLEQGKLVGHPDLVDFAKRAGITPVQAALAWILASDDMIAIPKTGSRVRLREIVGALDHPLSVLQLEELDRLLPRPPGPKQLEML